MSYREEIFAFTAELEVTGAESVTSSATGPEPVAVGVPLTIKLLFVSILAERPGGNRFGDAASTLTTYGGTPPVTAPRTTDP